MDSRLPRRSLIQALAVALPTALSASAREPQKQLLNLPSRVAEAKPITPDERKRRIESAQRLMQARKIDAYTTTDGRKYHMSVTWNPDIQPSEPLFPVQFQFIDLMYACIGTTNIKSTIRCSDRLKQCFE